MQDENDCIAFFVVGCSPFNLGKSFLVMRTLCRITPFFSRARAILAPAAPSCCAGQ